MAIPTFVSVVLMATIPLASAAQAALVTHEFSGSVVREPNPWGAPVGSSISGTMTYETGTVGGACCPAFGTDYVHSPPYDSRIGLTMVIGGSLFETDDSMDFTVNVFSDALQGDALRVFGSLPEVLELVDSTGTAFPDESLPSGLSLQDFDSARLFVIIATPQGFQAVTMGVLDTFQPLVTVAVLGAGPLGLLSAALAAVGMLALRMGGRR